jgi:hypothetical protein
VVKNLAREDTGDSSTQSVLAAINNILRLAPIKGILQDPTSESTPITRESRDATPQCTTTPHSTSRLTLIDWCRGLGLDPRSRVLATRQRLPRLL